MFSSRSFTSDHCAVRNSPVLPDLPIGLFLPDLFGQFALVRSIVPLCDLGLGGEVALLRRTISEQLFASVEGCILTEGK